MMPESHGAGAATTSNVPTKYARRMRVIDSVASLRSALDPIRRRGGRIALVPTMGALHEGHLTLIREAARVSDEVVVSVFVNPTQFTDAADLAAYPRDPETDAAMAASAGATVVFTPSPDEVYPAGFSTGIRVGGVSEPWEGAARGAAHFDGVALVVTKLFLMVGAGAAWFGRKDAQQVAVVRRLVRDLNIPIEIHAVPTVRDADGLALSSRNVRLSAADRAQALAIPRSLAAAREAVADGETDVASLTARATASLRAAGIEPEYWAIVDPDSFEPLDRLTREALAIVAAPVGAVRLIDNELLRA